MSKKAKPCEGQMQMNYDPVESELLEPQESALSRLLESHGTTEEDLDELEKRLGSYSLAFDALGITQKEIDGMGELPGDIYQDYSRIEPSSGVSVQLNERASSLLAAEKEYSKYSRNNSLVNSYYDGRPDLRRKFNDNAIEKISRSVDRYRYMGASAVRQAYRLKRSELIQAGFDADEIDAGEERAVMDFKERVVGSANADKRKKLKKAWEKQTK